MQRWKLKNPARALEWTMPINPNEMTSPHAQRNTSGYSVSPIDGQVRAFRKRPTPREWSFGGVIRTQEHHDTLRDWCDFPELIELTDHLNRRWQVRLVAFEPVERKPTPLVPWRFRYTVRCYVYRRLP